MEDKEGRKIQRITFALPPAMVTATEAMAEAEFCNVSTICRRALANTLASRGYLQEENE